jgi:hypothetical protein
VKQAQALSPQEREELIQRLVMMQSAASQAHEDEPVHWGQALNQLLDEIGPIELKYPEIEDPVAWVKHLRAEQRKRRLGDWGSDE